MEQPQSLMVSPPPPARRVDGLRRPVIIGGVCLAGLVLLAVVAHVLRGQPDGFTDHVPGDVSVLVEFDRDAIDALARNSTIARPAPAHDDVVQMLAPGLAKRWRIPTDEAEEILDGILAVGVVGRYRKHQDALVHERAVLFEMRAGVVEGLIDSGLFESENVAVEETTVLLTVRPGQLAAKKTPSKARYLIEGQVEAATAASFRFIEDEDLLIWGEAGAAYSVGQSAAGLAPALAETSFFDEDAFEARDGVHVFVNDAGPPPEVTERLSAIDFGASTLVWAWEVILAQSKPIDRGADGKNAVFR